MLIGGQCYLFLFIATELSALPSTGDRSPSKSELRSVRANRSALWSSSGQASQGRLAEDGTLMPSYNPDKKASISLGQSKISSGVLRQSVKPWRD